MMFENQSMIQNFFLPLHDITSKEVKLLYADNCDNNSVHFYFEDICSLKKPDVINKLVEVNFRDTYRDEPFLF